MPYEQREDYLVSYHDCTQYRKTALLGQRRTLSIWLSKVVVQVLLVHVSSKVNVGTRSRSHDRVCVLFGMYGVYGKTSDHHADFRGQWMGFFPKRPSIICHWHSLTYLVLIDNCNSMEYSTETANTKLSFWYFLLIRLSSWMSLSFVATLPRIMRLEGGEKRF
jgi:hypothetical protein